MPTKNKLTEIKALVLKAFDGDRDKTNLWYESPNPLLGNISPMQMLEFGRGEKLLQLVKELTEDPSEDTTETIDISFDQLVSVDLVLDTFKDSHYKTRQEFADDAIECFTKVYRVTSDDVKYLENKRDDLIKQKNKLMSKLGFMFRKRLLSRVDELNKELCHTDRLLSIFNYRKK